MAVRVWFEQDVRNILQAATLTAGLIEATEFRRGYRAALTVIGAAFGITGPEIDPAQVAPVIEIEAQAKAIPQGKAEP